MVGHRPLEASILVRIQVPQPFFPSVIRAFGTDIQTERRSRADARDKYYLCRILSTYSNVLIDLSMSVALTILREE